MSPIHIHGTVLGHRGNVTFILRLAAESIQTPIHWAMSVNVKYSTSCLTRPFVPEKCP